VKLPARPARPSRSLGSSLRRLRPISRRMRHFRLWLLLIGALSLAAEAVAAAAFFWRGSARRTARPTHGGYPPS
jgi:hypothetical protein